MITRRTAIYRAESGVLAITNLSSPACFLPRDVSEVTDMARSFDFATTFSHTLCWEVLGGTDTGGMFTNSGGGSVDPSCVYHCKPKTEAEWAALGCMVSGQPRATTRGDLGAGALTCVDYPFPPSVAAPTSFSTSVYPSSDGTRSIWRCVWSLFDHLPGGWSGLCGRDTVLQLQPQDCRAVGGARLHVRQPIRDDCIRPRYPQQDYANHIMRGGLRGRRRRLRRYPGPR